MAKYDNKTKYKIIDEVCNGKAAANIEREYGIRHATVMSWLRSFAENGPFKGDKLTPKDYTRLEKLQESAKKRELESKRVIRYQNETEELENSKYEAEQHGEIFEQHEELLKYEQLLQQELQKGDDIANNLNATLRLIDKCQKISKSSNDNDSSSTQLVPVGTVQDVGFLLEAEADEMHQLQAICNGAELFPETDASKALLKRSQIIDMTLLFNKKQPVMFTLSEEEQLLAGNQFMRLLIKRAGSLKEAIPYAIGRKKLEEIGIHNEFEKELKIMRYDAPLKLLSTNNDT